MKRPSKNFDWYPFNVKDYRRDTLHLTLAQDGAYRRLIDEYMVMGEALPDNDIALSRIIGCTLDDWLAVAPAVRPFFHPSNHKLVHKRCEEELHAQAMRTHSKRTVGKEAANARWKKHRELKQLDAFALRPQSESNAGLMPTDATKTKNITTTSSVSPRATPVETGDVVENQTTPARSLATALPAGALAREPSTEPAERPEAIQAKRPSELTRTELDAIIAKKSRSTEPDLTIPDFLRRTA